MSHICRTSIDRLARRAVASFICLGTAGMLGLTLVQAQPGSVDIAVDDPRPVAAAVQEFQRLCHCSVTYEDVKWQQNQVEDVSHRVQRASSSVRVEVPKGRPFTVKVSRQLDSQTPAQVRQALQDVLAASEAAGNDNSFRVLAGGGMLHVVPQGKAVFDAPLSLPRGDRTLGELIDTVLKLASAQTGETIVLGAAPLNLLRSARIEGFSATNEHARDVLGRALHAAAPERKLSWQLLYDFGRKTYYLSIQFVG